MGFDIETGTWRGAVTGAALTTAVIVLAVVLRTLGRFLRREWMLRSVPGVPGCNWALGHVVQLTTCVRKHVAAWDQILDWVDTCPGPLVKFRILGTHCVAFSDPAGMKRVFQSAYKIYEKDLALSYAPFLPILGTGLVTADGDQWQKQRTLMGPALRIDVLDDIIYIAKKAVDRMCGKLEPYRGKSIPVDVNEEFRLTTLQVIGEAMLSMSPEECDKVFPSLYLPVMEEANLRVLHPYRKYIPSRAWFQFNDRMAKLNTFLIDFFRTRWADRKAGRRQGRKDILDRILDSIVAAGTPWSTQLETQLCYETKTFLLAGHETSAAMLTWSLYELSQNAGHMDKVLDEAKKVFGSKEAEPARREVDGMTYTLAVLKEALRKYSVVPVVTRVLAKDDVLLGHKVPAGTMISCMLQGTHHRYKNPKTFDPERYMPGGEYDQFDEATRTFMFLPFIQGPRNCLGQHLALLEARVVLSLLVKRFKWRPANGAPLGWSLRSPTVIPIAPEGGLNMYID
ncbi:hypothetical protein FOA52_009970 [Chlamydomonas sp. UWO 241]|nr:hypothetical protein FOA52_009970 [Chlamydomonas sp. UWO 241]